jgi:crossover junction endodeoxyribonuclease RuvC
VLGIDPGTRFLGWAVVEEAGREKRALAYGVLKADPKLSLDRRLAILARGIREVLREHEPHEASIEEAFHGRDARAALKLGEARGAILLVVAEAGLPVTGYANNVVKSAVTGAGRAPKEQVRSMVVRILGLAEPPERLDASDALALALCHLQRRRLGAGGAGGAGTGGGGAGGGSGIPPRLAAALRAAKRQQRR